MTISSAHLSSEIEYPDTDGCRWLSDFQRQYLSYAVEVLRIYFVDYDVYVSGNLFIYTNKAIPKQW